MDWYYAQDGQQKGPVSDADLAGLVNSNVVTDHSLVWCAGMPNWRPYGEVKSGAAAVPSSGGGMICCECGRTFAPDQVVQHGDRYVCGACKPIFLQRLAEGASFVPQGSCTDEQLLQRDYVSPIGSCLSRGWETYKANMGAMLGTILLVGLIFIVVNGVPYLSIILAFVFNGPLMGGVWNYFLRHTRGQPAVLADAFSGFGPRFGQLLLANLVTGILSSLPMVPGYVVLIFGIIASAASGAKTAMVSVIVIGAALILAGMVATFYLSTLWIFTTPLVADKRRQFWPAMELSRKMVARHWWSNFGLMFVTGLITMIPCMAAVGVGVGIAAASKFDAQGITALVAGGVLGCLWLVLCVPFAVSAAAVRYNDIFGELTPEA